MLSKIEDRIDDVLKSNGISDPTKLPDPVAAVEIQALIADAVTQVFDEEGLDEAAVEKQMMTKLNVPEKLPVKYTLELIPHKGSSFPERLMNIVKIIPHPQGPEYCNFATDVIRGNILDTFAINPKLCTVISDEVGRLKVSNSEDHCDFVLQRVDENGNPTAQPFPGKAARFRQEVLDTQQFLEEDRAHRGALAAISKKRDEEHSPPAPSQLCPKCLNIERLEKELDNLRGKKNKRKRPNKRKEISEAHKAGACTCGDSNNEDNIEEPSSLAPSQEANDQDEGDACVICLEGKKTHLIVPCGHKCLCGNEDCHKIDTCPLCRRDVEDIIKVFD